MKITARQLNRSTLHRQLLLQRQQLDVISGVCRIVALQAQQAASPYIALWNRLVDFRASDLDAAFAAHTVVKASLMRITLHAVHVEDYPAFHAAMTPVLRGARLHDDRFKRTGLSIDDADELASHLVDFAAQSRTSAECEVMIDERVGVLPKPSVWWALRTFAPLFHSPAGMPWSFGARPSFVAANTAPHPGGQDDAVRFLIWRYLEGFGPASVPDITQFSMIARSTVRQALEAMTDSLVRMAGPDGKDVYDVPGAPLPAEETPAPARLMAMWDSVLLAYADRSRITPDEYRRLIIRSNGDVLPTLLVDGHVAGVWRPVEEGIEATAFHLLSEETWDELAIEARGMMAFLADREPSVYRRYANWWSTLPRVDVRVLPG